MTNIPEQSEKDKRPKSKSTGKEKTSDKKDSPTKSKKKSKKSAVQNKIYVESLDIP